MSNNGYLPSSTRPQPWDFVWCAYPFEETPHFPGPYHRPVIVRATAMIKNPKDGIEYPWVKVVYCTKQIDLIDMDSFIISEPQDKSDGGLYEDTLVRSNRQTKLPWHSHFFQVRKRDNLGPIIGQANASVRERLLNLIPNF